MLGVMDERFWSKVNKTDTCWLWTACCNHKGYGRFGIGGKLRAAHRVAYEWLVGPIPDGLQLDHLCRVRHCVNPAHLEPVTCRENLRRGVRAQGERGRRPLKPHCKYGHPFDEENTKYTRTGRVCRTCRRETERRKAARRKAARALQRRG